ncbi:MurR/RpiR family transcriptional regulator [Sporolactobacillus terrae]|uniref:MurR/RpiR family transcriptional regulator n=1 Tax=Sporolactobacillus terrae TaxID=269673 RepID=A0ABX5Q4V5_9BACL|nr:MurR/RpiR family transcriptional regulator [Sporolactobacillus terrae]QAA21660.1 MurR/RpiR family transcriptional regulator [Sporolactobacillus terrae]QAA24632.1 MurR/RpiR family transcriptional regulator [Sporolactobacillus terrae]UAK16468.1 MurR/RpiR family transcriptional regulator [Sporolactobacillus terrae]
MPSVYHYIAEQMPQMSKAQEKIARYILENPHTVPFLTVEKLAKMAQVGDATVFRFANYLGFSGYPELQQAMQASVQEQLTTSERLRLSGKIYDEKERGIREVFQDDINNIKSTIEHLDMDAFYKTADTLLQAKRIYIIAHRSAVSIGLFLQYYLNMMLDNVELIQSVEGTAEKLTDLGEHDAVIAVSFSRYTNATIDLFAFAKRTQAVTIAITDNLLSPLIPYADIALTAPSRIPTFIDSFVAPLSLINALLTYIGNEKKDVVFDRLDSMEKIWKQFNVFHK